MANIVVTGDTITTATWTAKTAAPGDGIPAVWKIDGWAEAPSMRPELRMATSGNTDKRKVRVTARIPYVLSGDTENIMRGAMFGSMDFDVPQHIPDVQVKSAIEVIVGALNSDLFYEAFTSQYAPTSGV